MPINFQIVFIQNVKGLIIKYTFWEILGHEFQADFFFKLVCIIKKLGILADKSPYMHSKMLKVVMTIS
jgi:hypothetical protein